MNTILLDDIRIDGGTQPRAETNGDAIMSYAEELAAGAKFPPVVLFHDGRSYWLADGFHRYHAAKKIGRDEIPCEVKKGSKRDAILYAVGANATHGMRRTNPDKRRAVAMVLKDKEWGQWSNREVARKCAVSEHMVRDARQTSAPKSQIAKRKVERGGTVYEQDTTNIGRQSPSSLAGDETTTSDEPPIEYKHPQKPDPVAGSMAMEYAGQAIATLSCINQDDPLGGQALDHVASWIKNKRGKWNA